jgi:hypothetical protein
LRPVSSATLALLSSRIASWNSWRIWITFAPRPLLASDRRRGEGKTESRQGRKTLAQQAPATGVGEAS